MNAILEVVIRPATPADSSAMKEIFNREIEISTSVWHWLSVDDDEWAQWYTDHTSDRNVLLVAEVDSTVAGFAGYSAYRKRAGFVDTVENSIFIHEDYRGLGVAKVLLERLVEEARTRSLHTIIAVISGDNLASVSLHLSSGFVEVGRMKQVGQKFGQWLDLFYLQILLDEKQTPMMTTMRAQVD